MNFRNLLLFLKALTFLIGGQSILLSWYYSWKSGSPGPLYITKAIIIAGPLETFLQKWAEDHLPPEKAQEMVLLVDYLTSFGFILLLDAAIRSYD